MPKNDKPFLEKTRPNRKKRKTIIFEHKTILGKTQGHFLKTQDQKGQMVRP